MVTNCAYNAAHGVPAMVSRLEDAITAADGLPLVTPEYNNSIPGLLQTPTFQSWLLNVVSTESKFP